MLRGAGAALANAGTADAPALDAQSVNAAQLAAPSGKKGASAPSTAVIIKAEVLLGRAGFSPGVIDGKTDMNVAHLQMVAGFPWGQQVAILRTASRFIRGISDQSDITE
ncbi:MAG: hypothetical protein WB822_08925 [Rhodoplanes sp.]